MALLEKYYKNIEVDRRGISMTLPPEKGNAYVQK